MKDNSPAHIWVSWAVTVLGMTILIGIGFIAQTGH